MTKPFGEIVEFFATKEYKDDNGDDYYFDSA